VDAAEHVPAVLLTAVDHVGLAVPDLDAAIAFHTSVLGLELRHREENAEQGVAEAMLAPVGSQDPAAQIQLIAPLDETSPIARFLDRSGPGLQQLAYRVDDVEAAADELRRRGVRLIYDSARSGTRGSRINFIHPKDTGGVLIELVEVRKGRAPAAGEDAVR
jgi:methylmalonyl-CoA/ethylmalonyl-CoA epimerase